MSSTDAIVVKLPWICDCGCITGKLTSANNPANPKHAADAICAGCGKRCASVNDTTMRMLTSIAEKFGTPAEPSYSARRRPRWRRSSNKICS